MCQRWRRSSGPLPIYFLLIAVPTIMVPILAFANFRLYRRTGHEGDAVILAGVLLVICSVNSFVILGQMVFPGFYSLRGLGTVFVTSLWILLVSGVLTALMVLILSLKHWPYSRLDRFSQSGVDQKDHQ